MAGMCRPGGNKGMGPLQAIGLLARAEVVSLDLLQNPDTTPAELTARHGDVAPCLAELVGLGLIERSADAVVVRPPRLAMDALAERHTKEAALARESADLLSELWKT